MKNRTVQKRWYHATTKKAWKKIKKEGVLWGLEGWGMSRHTFLARNWRDLVRMCDSKKYQPWNRDMFNNELHLSVRYTPNGTADDYDSKSWEMIVKKPISTENVRLLKYI